MNKKQIDFWTNFLSTWTPESILEVLRFVMAECSYFPVAADWVRLRPSPKTELILPPVNGPEGLGPAVDRAYGHATGFHKWMLGECKKALKAIQGAKAGSDERNSIWFKYYTTVSTEAKRLGLSDDAAMFGASAKRYAPATTNNP